MVLTREEFRKWLFQQHFKRKVTVIQQHHTWMPSYRQFKGNNHMAMLQSMKSFHMRRWGWSNIAQNITTFPDGRIAICRPFDVAPQGSIGYRANVQGLTIENIGNFDVGHDVMTKEQKDTIVYVTALLCIKYGLSPSIDTITYHHWWDLGNGRRVLDQGKPHNVKSCPGTAFFGGNSTISAKRYFYPLVSRKIQEVLASMRKQ